MNEKTTTNDCISSTLGDNAPDYQDNLYFEPKPTWNDVVKVAEKYGYEEIDGKYGKYIINNKEDSFVIYPDGHILDESCDYCYTIKPRTYAQLIKFLEVVYG